MSLYSELKSIWKKLGVNGQVKNYSSVALWVVETDTRDFPIARILLPGYKTPNDIDVDGFKRVDGKAIQGHKYWWKFYDFSTVEVSTDKRGLRISAISKSAVNTYNNEEWGTPLVVIMDVKRDSKNKINSYYVNGYGWLDFETTLKMTCYHEIDNARPVFPKNGLPYIRSRRDKSILNNFSKVGIA